MTRKVSRRASQKIINELNHKQVKKRVVPTDKNLFDVVVIATMSAGKSTVINALIGHELLHSANEATTATITRIHDQDNLRHFSGSAYSYQNELIAESDKINDKILREWNADSHIKFIDLVGDIQALQNDQNEIVIYDTPGPNNSQDDNHEALTLEVINDGHYGLILYVLNATQLGVNDDLALLEKIQATLAKYPEKEIIFLLNKADQLDEEKGETIEKVVENAKNYLAKIGFTDKPIIPTSASQALIIQKILNKEKLTRRQTSELKNFIHKNNTDFIHSAHIDTALKTKALKKIDKLRKNKKDVRSFIIGDMQVTSRFLNICYIQSGFGLISMILQDKLNKNVFTNVAKEKAIINSGTVDNIVISHGKKNLIDKKTSQICNNFNKPTSNIKEKNMSNSIYIEHNPFTIETRFEVNGEPAENISFFETNRNRRLQLWIEQLFPALYNVFGNPHFQITFKGVESDFIDVEEAAKKAKEDGLMIDLDYREAVDSATRLIQIQELMSEAKAHPVFEEKLKNTNSSIHKNFEAALNKDFDVYVAATMSAGKSTLINAMLGTDLLPAANEATTATIAQITDNDSMPVGEFKGFRFDKNDVEVDGLTLVDLNTLVEWNQKPDTKLIKLEGNIIGVKERENVRLVITDTPGPNNSQDPEHSRTTMKHISDSVRNPLILYILNATQLGTKDDQNVLGEISKIMAKGGKQSKDRFIFVVNKMDQFDPEAGENVEKALERVTKYLKDNGIEDPLIYPVSANLTRLWRKRETNPDALTRKERNDLQAMEDLFDEEPSMDFIQYMPLTSSARRNLTEKRLPKVLNRSGLPAIESMIDEYIDKYNLPNRVNRAYQALSEAIKVSSDEAQLTASLAEYTNQIDQIEEQVKELKANKDVGNKAKAKLEGIINDKKSLYPQESLKKFDKQEAEIRNIISEFQEDFVGNDELTVKEAERKLRHLQQDIEWQANRLINRSEEIILEAQKSTEETLSEVFNQYVKDLFEGVELPMPVLDGLKAQLNNIKTLTGLKLNKDEIETTTERVKTGTETRRIKVGEREVSTSKWYNPFSWGSSRTEDVYADREFDVYENRERQYVDSDALWENREQDILNYFNKLTTDARNKIMADTETYANEFKDFMDKEFTLKFKAIVDELEQKVADKGKVQAEIKLAEEKLAQIREFSRKLTAVLEL